MLCCCQYTLYNRFHFWRDAAKSQGHKEHFCSTNSLTQTSLIIEYSAKFWIKLREAESSLSYPHIQAFHMQLTSQFQSPRFLIVQSHWSWCWSPHPCYNTEDSLATPSHRKKTEWNCIIVWIITIFYLLFMNYNNNYSLLTVFFKNIFVWWFHLQ